MKKKTVFGVIILLFLLLAIPASASAATVKLNKTKMTVYVGQKKTLKVSGTSKTVKWSSSKKSVARVSSSGAVRGIKAGTATITAKVGTKTYKCKVTVKENTWDAGYNLDNANFWKKVSAQRYTGSYTVKVYPAYLKYDESGQLCVILAVRNETAGKTYTLKSAVVKFVDESKEVIASGYFRNFNRKIKPNTVEYIPLRFSSQSTKQYVALKKGNFMYSISIY
ncbi:MAG: Ig-like domain-containing protein [Lachnospiraceae bacterium]|nr:Ig-like domain-containing protein [Lachnospiraceae bacterium]